MGTRADFYIGRGLQAEWLGSIAYDGYPDGIPEKILSTKKEEKFRRRVQKFVHGRDDGTKPEDGWPWPWDNSKTTDYAYALDEGKVWVSNFGGSWYDPFDDGREALVREEDVSFPDMTAVKKVTLGPRSGVMLIPVEKGSR